MAVESTPFTPLSKVNKTIFAVCQSRRPKLLANCLFTLNVLQTKPGHSLRAGMERAVLTEHEVQIHTVATLRNS